MEERSLPSKFDWYSLSLPRACPPKSVLVVSMLAAMWPATLLWYLGYYSFQQGIVAGGLVLLVCGVLMVIGHNLWVPDWRVLVTIVAWAVLLESIVLILAPRILAIYAGWSEATMTLWLRFGGTLWALAGAFVLYFSHFG